MKKKLNEYKSHLDNTEYVVTDNEAKMLSAFREGCTRIGCSDHYLNRQLKHAFEIHVPNPFSRKLIAKLFKIYMWQ